MGNVYLAEHKQLGRKVAIKSLHAQLVNNDSLRARFKNEASTMAHLQHPNIVALYDYLETEDGLYLVMEYVKGIELDDYIRNNSGPIPEDKSVAIFTGVLQGFQYAHDNGVVHRDIKPSNILLREGDHEPKILDFGIAKMVDDASKKLTKTGTQMGTVYYMSPEQVKGQQADNRSDIYSLGVTLFQMVTGTNPYDGKTTEYEVYDSIVNVPLPKASTIHPGVSEKLEGIIKKATAKKPEDRFQSCKEFLEDLHGVSSTIATDHQYTFDETEASRIKVKKESSSTQQHIDRTPPVKKKSKVGVIVFVLILVVGGATAAFFLTENSDDASSVKSKTTESNRVERDDAYWEYVSELENRNPNNYNDIEYLGNSSALKSMDIIDIDRVIVSSEMASSGGYVYNKQNLIDNNLRSWWSPEDGDEIDSWVEFWFRRKEEIRGLYVINGSRYPNHTSFGDLYYKNGRVTRVKVFIDGEYFDSFSLSEYDDNIQRLEFSSTRKAKSIRIIVTKVVHGSEWDDVCISLLMPYK